jgi:hypothetical protein
MTVDNLSLISFTPILGLDQRAFIKCFEDIHHVGQECWILVLGRPISLYVVVKSVVASAKLNVNGSAGRPALLDRQPIN